MKKILIGCGVIILLGIIGLAVTCYGLYRVGKSMIDSATEIQAKYQAVDAKYSFSAPADGALTEAQIDKWIEIRKAVAAPSSEFRGLMSGKAEGFGAVKKMFSLMKQLATDHAAALDTNQMSSGEYVWITEQVLGVITSDEGKKNEKIKALADEIDRIERQGQASGQMASLSMMGATLSKEQLTKMIPLVETRSDQIAQLKDVFALDAFIIDIIRQNQFQSQSRAGAGSVSLDDEDEESTETEETTTPARPAARPTTPAAAPDSPAASPAATPEGTPEVSYH